MQEKVARGMAFQNKISKLAAILKGHRVLCFTNCELQLSLVGQDQDFYKTEVEKDKKIKIRGHRE